MGKKFGWPEETFGAVRRFIDKMFRGKENAFERHIPKNL